MIEIGPHLKDVLTDLIIVLSIVGALWAITR